MGAQGIYLRDSRHSGHKGRSYGSTGTYQIPVLVGLPHQFLCNDVHYGKSIGDNGVQFPLQPCRSRSPEDPVHRSHGPHYNRYHVSILIRVFNNRRTFIRPDRADSSHISAILFGIGDDNLFRLLSCPDTQIPSTSPLLSADTAVPDHPHR